MSRNIAVVAGTRPEVIKLVPVVQALRRRGANVTFVSTGQQRDLSREIFRDLGMAPDLDLDLMAPGQSPLSFTQAVLAELPAALQPLDCDDVVVQGDTATAFAAAFVGYQMGVRVSHVEAGLRTGDHANPFPEEGNRRLIAQIASLHFAPTDLARANLLREGIDPGDVHVVGNTAIDALLACLRSDDVAVTADDPGTLLVTLHRRESFGEPLEAIVAAVARFLDGHPDATVAWPVHPNPKVRAVVSERFASHPRVELLEPQPYRSFIALLATARLVLSDSGGVQEEAPSLGKVVLIARDATERSEALSTGQNVLVGRTEAGVLHALDEGWMVAPYAGAIPAPSPFGDGTAGEAIAGHLMGLP